MKLNIPKPLLKIDLLITMMQYDIMKEIPYNLHDIFEVNLKLFIRSSKDHAMLGNVKRAIQRFYKTSVAFNMTLTYLRSFITSRLIKRPISIKLNTNANWNKNVVKATIGKEMNLPIEMKKKINVNSLITFNEPVNFKTKHDKYGKIVNKYNKGTRLI